MLRLNINSQKHGICWLDFPTQIELDQYLANIGGHWGIPARQEITPEVVDLETGEILQQSGTVEIPGTVTFSIEDITSSILQETLQKEGLGRQQIGAKIVAKVWAVNESKQISAEQFSSLLNDSNIARIERLLWSGSLKTAKMLISQLDATYFSLEEKNSILAMMSEY